MVCCYNGVGRGCGNYAMLHGCMMAVGYSSCDGAYGRSRCSCSSGFSFCFVRGRGKERVIVLEFRLEV